MSARSTSWSTEDDAKLMAACNSRRVSQAEWRKIAAQFTGRSVAACKQRGCDLKRRAKGIMPPERLRAGRGDAGRVNRNIEMQTPPAPHKLPQHTSLTAAFCGDPLPGRSELDQRQST